MAAVAGGLRSGLIEIRYGSNRQVPKRSGREISPYPGAGLAPDLAPPVVRVVSPATGSQISSNTQVVIDVVDNRALRQVMLVASYPSDITELIHDGARFRGLFAQRSVVSDITGGKRYTIERQTGWPSSPTVEVYPVDTSGNTA